MNRLCSTFIAPLVLVFGLSGGHDLGLSAGYVAVEEQGDF